MTTTISEQAVLRGVDVDSIRWQLTKNNIEPIERKKWVLRGYIGRPYLFEDIERAMKGFRPDKAIALRNIPKRKVKTHYSQKEVCEVLRFHVKSPLNNKMVKSWNEKDWGEFNSLKKQTASNNNEAVK